MTYRLQQPNQKPRQLRTWLTLAAFVCSFGIASLGYGITTAQEGDTTATQPTNPERKLMIYEVKQGKNTHPSEQVQFVTIYNPNDTAVTVENWNLEYIKNGFETAFCSAAEWRAHTAGAVAKRRIIGSSGADAANIITIAGHQVSGQIPLDINDNTPGSVHLVDKAGTVHDTVGWGYKSSTPNTINVCSETVQVAHFSTDDSLIRYLGCNGIDAIDTDNNANDFYLSATLAAATYGSAKLPICSPLTEPPEEEEEEPAAPPTEPPVTPTPPSEIPINCQGVTISESLVNPVGTDTGHEFIELHNTLATAVSLQGCSLQTSASSSKLYTFGDISLAAGSYQAFYDSETGLTLPNASGGSIWLLDATNELQAVTYPADPEDDVVWTLADGAWGLSYTATPNAANILTASKPCPAGQVRNTETNRCVTEMSDTTTASGSSPSLTACDPGQERNPETNRCRAVTTATSTACPAGQSRNPETNRCRVTTAATANVTACKAGQERNPETNRCRNTTSGVSDTKACPTGQERNPDTNRCRKVTAAGTADGTKLSDVQDIASSSPTSKPYWLVAVLALLAALGYGVYEWRQEITTFVSKRLGKLRPAVQS